ncbi:MAG: hypothetical protein JST61_06375 [Acidobacteria bacterium]|nr:hypothetical protein [Acidobacteriota bacterium]
MRSLVTLAAALILTATAQAQFELQDSHSTASFRGIHSVGNGIAWASGTEGTILRTTDDGKTWQRCTTPPGAEKLDFRGIQAFDQNAAIVMSSGKGDLSRLYKTTDGCKTWKLLLTNPDKDGFWDTLQMYDSDRGWLFGDPVQNRFVVAEISDGGDSVSFLGPSSDGQETNQSAPRESTGRGAFAASNSAIALAPRSHTSAQRRTFNAPCTYSIAWFGTSGPGGARVLRFYDNLPQCSDWGHRQWASVEVPIRGDLSTAGVFSLAAANDDQLVAVGGDYSRADDPTGTSSYSTDSGQTWSIAQTPPHGYRSAVAYDAASKTWITVGPNGTDISRDDGRNWSALKPSAQDAPDADENWNALSLPFVVGPKGRIGKLRPGALKR